MEAKPNVALVILDTLRKDAFDQEFGWLKQKSVVYDNTWSTSHWTVPAHASLFTGRYAREVGTHAKNRHLNYPKPTIVELLHRSGYRTRAITANSSITPEFNFDRGFDDLFYIEGENLASKHMDAEQGGLTQYLSAVTSVLQSDDPPLDTILDGVAYKFGLKHYDDSGAAKTYDLLSRMDFSDREFLFLNLMEAHTPYDPPEEYLTGSRIPSPSLFKASTIGSLDQNASEFRRGYNDAVQYLSDQYKMIFDLLHANFDFIVTISDHGESLGEEGNWCHVCGLSPSITHIPFAISGKTANVEPTDQPVNLLDIYQTICDLAGVEPDSEARGKSLTSPLAARSVFFETHGVIKKLEESAEELGIPRDIIELYDVPRFGVASRDGFAYQTHKDNLRRDGSIQSPGFLIEELDDQIPANAVEESGEISEATQKRLDYLGYI